MLEVCAGTCLMGRTLAPQVHEVTCLAATPAMLAQGRKLAEEAGLSNMQFVEGLAEELPFKDGSFDLVVTRLSFHHLQDAEAVFREMKRVATAGGKIVVADMLAAPEPYREARDHIERLRDPSRERCFSKEELEEIYRRCGCAILSETMSDLPHTLSGWMDLTHTPEDTQERIRSLMQEDLDGGSKTGFFPYLDSAGEISFDQHWLLIVGTC